MATSGIRCAAAPALPASASAFLTVAAPHAAHIFATKRFRSEPKDHKKKKKRKTEKKTKARERKPRSAHLTSLGSASPASASAPLAKGYCTCTHRLQAPLLLLLLPSSNARYEMRRIGLIYNISHITSNSTFYIRRGGVTSIFDSDYRCFYGPSLKCSGVTVFLRC